MPNKPPKTIIIQTITPSYDDVEDRIRLSINYQDIDNRIDLMLTRSFLLKLIPVVEEYTYKHYPDEITEDEIQLNTSSYSYDNSSSQNNNPKPTKPSNKTETNMEDLQLYQGLEDLLHGISLSYDKSTTNTTFTFSSKNKHKAIISCNIEILNNIIDSIKKSVPKIAWGIGYL